ncbi:MAG: sugar ABC transporter permease [Anaerolineae bacterium]|nr:sugar ABC transporter permease [Anaerolineae bacterium]
MTTTIRRRPRYYLLVFLLPATVLYSVFLAIPLLDSLRLSLFQEQAQGPDIFVGLSNFHTLFTDPIWSGRFANALGNNIKFFAVHIVVQMPIAILLATLLTSRRIRGANFFRTVIFAPSLLSFVIVGFIWQLMLNPVWGIVDNLLRSIGLGSVIMPWLGDPRSALLVVSLVSSWQFMGLGVMLFSAALLSISSELLDAAMVDGANGWSIFWRIRFPLILPTVGLVFMLTFIGLFNAFDIVYTMQGQMAPPNFGTDILGTFFYRTAFGAGAFSVPNPIMGTTIATVVFFIILTGVAIYLFFVQRRLVRV